MLKYEKIVIGIFCFCFIFVIFVMSLMIYSDYKIDNKTENRNYRDEYGCHYQDVNYKACHNRGVYFSDICIDTAVLVATTAGSPNSHSCNNYKHKMRVETATKYGEEIASLIYCECFK